MTCSCFLWTNKSQTWSHYVSLMWKIHEFCFIQSSVCRGKVHMFPVFCVFIQKLNRTRASDMLVLSGCWHFLLFFPSFHCEQGTWGWTHEWWLIMQLELKRKFAQKSWKDGKKILFAAVHLIQSTFLISLRIKIEKTALMGGKKTIKGTNLNKDLCCLYFPVDDINTDHRKMSF